MFDVASLLGDLLTESLHKGKDPEGSEGRRSTDPGDLKGAFMPRNFPEVDDNKTLSQ